MKTVEKWHGEIWRRKQMKTAHQWLIIIKVGESEKKKKSSEQRKPAKRKQCGKSGNGGSG